MILKKYLKQIILIAVAFILLLAAGVYAGYKLGQGQRITGEADTQDSPDEEALDAYAVDIDKEYLDSLSNRDDVHNDNPLTDGSKMKYHLFKDVYFISGNTVQELPIWNDPVNELAIKVDVWLEDEWEADGIMLGTTKLPLISTGAITPGKRLMQVELSRPLEAGTYQATFVFTPIGGAGTVCLPLEAHSTIHVM